MTPETEERMLERLASMDARLKTIEEAAELVRRHYEGIARAEAFARNVREGR